VSEKATYYCDAPDCDCHGGAQDGHRQPPVGFLTVTESGADPARFLPLHFCGWDCALKYAAAQEPTTVIPFHDEGDAP
jgi:hypothetical protein